MQGFIPALVSAVVVTGAAISDAVGAPLCADKVGQGLCVAGNVGGGVVLADAAVLKRVLWTKG